MFTNLNPKFLLGSPTRAKISFLPALSLLSIFALLTGCGGAGINAITGSTASGTPSGSTSAVRTIFVIAMENHNWIQPFNQFSGGTQQIFQNSSAPFINSLVNGTATNISPQVAYAAAYHNVLGTSSGDIPGLHPSEPNYI